jgi:beta-glucosidase
MKNDRRLRGSITLLAAALLLAVAYPGGVAHSQAPARVARIPGIDSGPCNPGPEEKPWLNPNQAPGCRSLEAIAAMTLEEKLVELGGITGRSANKRLGLISGGGSDGPNGIATMGATASARGRNVTAFAQAVTLAATWDRSLASRFGKAVGEEFSGKGSNSVLGPTINIMRTWHWGRNGETFSEDPYLTAEIAVPEIKALNEQKVLTVLKHYAGNNQENTRCGIIPDNAGIDARISGKALNEIYLPGFKASVERAKTGGIMCSYNQLNGTFACNHPELLGYLRQWGFDGFIAPDAGFALRDPLTAARAGVTRVGGTQVGGFLKDGKLTEDDLNRMLYYNMTPYFRLGIYDSPSQGKPDADVSTPEHQALARQVAEEGAVLLKNKGAVLPIAPPLVKSIAVIGDDAGPHVTIGLNGSGHVFATKVSVPIDAIKERAGRSIKVTYEPGTAGIGPLPAIPVSALKPAIGEGQGLTAWYLSTDNSTGVPVVSRVEPMQQAASGPPPEYYKALGLPVPAPRGMMGGPGGAPPTAAPQPGVAAPVAMPAAPGATAAPGPGPSQAGGPGASSAAAGRGAAGGPGGGGSPFGARRAWSARWFGKLTPPSTGTYVFSVTGSGTTQLYVNHELVATMMRADFAQTVQGTIKLKAGVAVPIEIKYSNSSSIMGSAPALGWQPPDPDMRARAVAAAKAADVAIVFAAEQMGEGQDKVTLALPGDQDDLILAVAAANPRTVVVLHTSNPEAMPWLDKVAAVVEAFYPGQEAGSSIARLLFGDVNPSGKLAMTFPANEHQGPGTFFLDYPGDGMTANYTEGVLVGYRWYDARKQEPLFPFGHGLSYTTFAYSGLQVQHAGGERATVSVRVANVGTRAGAEVVQLYLGAPAAAQEPPKQLRGFEKILLKPGESKVVTLTLDKDSFAAWDTETHGWMVHPGTYSVMVGSSSRDIRLKGALTIASR